MGNQPWWGPRKVTGDLKSGSKVTIEYTMKAATIEVKEAKAAAAKKSPRGNNYIKFDLVENRLLSLLAGANRPNS